MSANKIPTPIANGLEPFYVLAVKDDSGKGNGSPIIWEHQIPDGCGLQAVLRHRKTIGDRYGTTYVAECRIIPELTEIPEIDKQPF